MLLDDELKAAWYANIPAVMVEEDMRRRQLDPNTPEGVYHRTLALTGDVQLADKLKAEVAVAKKLAAATAPQG